jgi:tRNA-specific 2-thiouridylase
MPQLNAKNKKVFVGLSGGVDSSVSAAILKDQGYDVTGVFIKAWHPDFLPCNWREEMHDAMRVCAKLRIPFLKLDLEKEYKAEVIDYLISEYAKGKTPNPDVFCNKEIKFGHFLDFAIKNGADYVATGHYAQTISQNGTTNLLKGADQEKDQTYFLWTLPQEKISKIIFPIGSLQKSKVRKQAKKYNLHTATKKDSQGLCFLGHVNMEQFLKRFLDLKKGGVLNQSGEVIGEHEGAEIYTIGQRHGFEIFDKNIEREILYVVDKDVNKNTITVSSRQRQNTSQAVIELENVNLTRQIQDKELANISFKYRYRGAEIPAKLTKSGDTHQLELKEYLSDVASGQSAVFYIGNECIGGGIIK